MDIFKIISLIESRPEVSFIKMHYTNLALMDK